MSTSTFMKSMFPVLARLAETVAPGLLHSTRYYRRLEERRGSEEKLCEADDVPGKDQLLVALRDGQGGDL